METNNQFIEKIPAEMLYFQNGNNEQWLAFIGIKDEKPMLFLTYKNEGEKLRFKTSNCFIYISKDTSDYYIYDIEFFNQDHEILVLRDVLQTIEPVYRNYTLFISALLENRVRIEEINNILIQCGFGCANLNSWEAGVKRIIRRYLPPEILESENLKCPDCKGKLEIKFGCYICPFCGYARS